MTTFVKWFTVILLASVSWLIGVITLEYFRPYKKVPVRIVK
jgi:hypothetical protein